MNMDKIITESDIGRAVRTGEKFLVDQLLENYEDWKYILKEERKWSKEVSKFLAEYNFKKFKDWWDPNKFSYLAISELSKYCRAHFKIWWPFIESIDIVRHFISALFRHEYRLTLINLCTFHYKNFEIWWPKVYLDNDDWFSCSKHLAWKCNKHFKMWWDPDKFNWRKCRYLASYCKEYFDDWFIKEKINYAYCITWLILEYPEKFDTWFIKGRINVNNIFPKLIRKYPDRFDDWFDPDVIVFYDEQMRALQEFCPDKKHIWGPISILKRLEREDRGR